MLNFVRKFIGFAMYRLLSKDGEGQRPERCSQKHVQCREAWQASGHDPTVIESDHQVPFGDAEARLAKTLMTLFVSSLIFEVFYFKLNVLIFRIHW